MASIRQNYHEECEAVVNKQINLELYASYVYMSMVSSNFSQRFLFYLLILLAQIQSNLTLESGLPPSYPWP